MERHLNQRFSCAIYALTEDPDYLVFDADLWEGRDIVGADPSEYSAVALVELRPGSVELVLDHGDGAYRLATDTGRYNAQQVVCGDAGAVARVTGLPHDQDGEDEDDDTEEEVVGGWSDENAKAPPLVGEGECEGCNRDDMELYAWVELKLCFDCVLLGREGRWS